MSGKKRNTDAVELLRRRYVDGDSDRLANLAEERRHAKVARQVYALRKQAGLSQAELAEKIGTTQSAVSRLEDADWERERETLHVLENRSLMRQISRSLETHEAGTGHRLTAEALEEIDRL
jgi:ribosome-binding protein aMBF1 (putative translation factor)